MHKGSTGMSDCRFRPCHGRVQHMTSSAIHKIEASGFRIAVSEEGAQLMSLAWGGREYLWQGDERWWPRRAPILFPIIGVVAPNETCSRGACHMKRHGVARTQRFQLIGEDERTLAFGLNSNEQTLASFPYRFRLQVSYEIFPQSPTLPAVLPARSDAGTPVACLRQRFRVENLDSVGLPFTVGGHPAFNLLTASDGKTVPFDRHELRFCQPWDASTPTMDEQGMLDFSRMIPLSRGADALPLNRRLFDNDTLVLSHVPDSTVALVSNESPHGVQVSFAGFAYLGIWSAAREAPFVAIEPWTGCSTAYDEGNSLERKRGMRILAPGQADERSFDVALW
jgi:galactose mutarotase-like enzyme